jgi:glutamate carboxypeptidase
VFDGGTMTDDLRRLVEAESPSLEIAALQASAAGLADLIAERLGERPVLVDGPAGPHVHLRRDDAGAKVLVVGHHDTVFPLGTLARRPFDVRNGRATGPGVFDMKGGIVQAVHAVASLTDRSGVELLFTADEEVGSATSRLLIEERARACGAVLVLEPSADGGALKIGRKGVGTFEVIVEGRAAHAGLEPHLGVNALVEAAHQVGLVAALGNLGAGTTVTPTVARAGTAENVVPAEARFKVDVRVTSAAETARIEAAMAALRAVDPAAVVRVEGSINRPPMPASASASLFPLAERAAAAAGLGAIDGVSVGGGSDGNFTAAIGVPTLDGLGAVGGGAHADHEWIDVTAMPQRARMLAALLVELGG